MATVNAINRAITAGVASVQVADLNPSRVTLVIINDSDTAVYLWLAPEAQVNSGIRLNATGGSYEINLTNPYYGKVSAISSGAAKVLTVMETSYAG
jgi:hypothetical protein